MGQASMDPACMDPPRRPERVFAVVALVVGLTLAVLTPPFQGPDEATHFLRLYQLSEGVIVAPRHGCVVPVSLGECFTRFDYLKAHPAAKCSWSFIRPEFGRWLDPARTQFLPIDNTAAFSPLPYLPAIVTTAIARKLDASPVVILYAGRAATVLAYAALGWAAIAVTPVLRWPLALVLAGPLPLFLAGTDSADPVTIGGCALATGLTLRLAHTGGRAWSVAVTMVAVPLCKSAYAPLVGLVLGVPVHRWGRSRGAAPAGVVVFAAAGCLAWSAVSDPMGVRERAGDPQAQLRWASHHPAAYAAVVGRTVVAQGPGWAYGSLGSLGWLDTRLSPWWVDGYLLITVGLAVNDGSVASPTSRLRSVAALACGTSLLLIMTLVYAVWDPPGAATIEGVQGRYALPLALAGLVVVRRRSRRSAGAWPAGVVAAMAVYTVVTVVRRYYIAGA